jgi:hypothetical protein
MPGSLATVAAAMFAGAALYVSVAEHPARIRLDNHAALAEWHTAYPRATIMQVTLALVAGLLGLVEGLPTLDFRWLAGSAAILANIPYTFLVVWGINKQLRSITPDRASPESRELLTQWGRLHTVRTVLGITGALLFAWALHG